MKENEKHKAHILTIIISVIYISLLIVIFHFLIFPNWDEYTTGSITNFILPVTVTALSIGIILTIIESILVRIFTIRDGKEYRKGLVFSYFMYILAHIIYLSQHHITFIPDNATYLLVYYAINILIIYIFTGEYNTFKLGIYVKQLDKYITFENERVFRMYYNLYYESLHEVDILTYLTHQLEQQPEHKAHFYYLKKHIQDNKVYVILIYSKSGKSETKLLSDAYIYTKADYERKLEVFNNKLNEHLNHTRETII